MRAIGSSTGLAALALLCACDGDFSDDYHRVDGVRLLAVRAEPPEVSPGDTVMLAALAAGGGTITVRWMGCALPPLPGRGVVNPECLTADLSAPHLVPLGTGMEISVTIPAVPAELLGSADVTGGRYVPIRLRVEGGGSSIDGIYRLRYRSPGAPAPAMPNRNPRLDGIYFVDETGERRLDESAPPTVAADAQLALAARFVPGSAEPYAVDEGGKLRDTKEAPDVTWFATAGRFAEGTTKDGAPTILALDRHPPRSGSIVDIWIVGRDERGGADWLHRTLTVR